VQKWHFCSGAVLQGGVGGGAPPRLRRKVGKIGKMIENRKKEEEEERKGETEETRRKKN